MKKSFPVYLLVGIFLIVVAFIVFSISTGKTNVLNAPNSYLFASPLMARSGGDKIRITVFALDGRGKGIPNKVVGVKCRDLVACESGGLAISEVQPQTDGSGQAVFDISATSAGKFELMAVVSGTEIPQTVTVSFQ